MQNDELSPVDKFCLLKARKIHCATFTSLSTLIRQNQIANYQLVILVQRIVNKMSDYIMLIISFNNIIYTSHITAMLIVKFI